ncbi:hypothetical protein GJAV_G00239800 [Gymnothorax javanicus]|nr:hypothetical protein GJAV_G00239800 [Gymnothorax javanicus]
MIGGPSPETLLRGGLAPDLELHWGRTGLLWTLGDKKLSTVGNSESRVSSGNKFSRGQESWEEITPLLTRSGARFPKA